MERSVKMSDLKVGFIGLGNMGITMARALVRHDIIPTVYDLRPEPVEELVSMGATGVGSCREVAEVSDVVISMVWDIPQTDEVIYGKDGVWEGIKEGSIIIITSSIGPDYCQTLYEKAKERNISVIDCAVSGAPPSIDNRPACEMIGGDDDVVKKCWHIFEAMGDHPLHLGGIGMGQAHKLVDNMTARHFGTVMRLCLIEGLNFGLKYGLDLKKMINVASVSAFSRGMQTLGLESGLEEEEIVRRIRVPMHLLGSKHGRVNELDYAMEMAEKAGAKLPLFHTSDDTDVEKVYDTYYNLVKKYIPEPQAFGRPRR
jgi:3-hydroxyisobutyrate dehydrogenase-like beta-hydroxyacid dehydrogenase